VSLLYWSSSVSAQTAASAKAHPIALYVDADGAPLNAAQSRYVLRFEDRELPPAGAFWSVTMYDGKTHLLADNLIDRYLIDSPMLPQLKPDPDGGLTLYIQHQSPGPERESNWLPAPDGPFYLIMRIYQPEPVVLSGAWKAPPLQPVTEGRAVDDQR
jgi:hypothetical protein